MSNAVQGAARGGLMGAAAGGLARGYRDTRLLSPELGAAAAVPATARRIGAGITNFGKRQVHGFTGKFDPDAIGMQGNTAAGAKAKLLNRRALDEIKHNPEQATALLGANQKEIETTLASGRQGQALRAAGVTNLKDMVGALRDPSRRGGALHAMGTTLTSGGGPGGAALALGAPLAMSAPTLLRGDESAHGGATLGQKVRGVGLNVAAGGLTGGLPILPQMVVGGAFDAGTRRLSGSKVER